MEQQAEQLNHIDETKKTTDAIEAKIANNMIGKYFIFLLNVVCADFSKSKVSQSFQFMDVEMTDSDCSEDYDNDPFFQQSGYAFFAQRQQFMKEAILADKQNHEADPGEVYDEGNQEEVKAA